MAEYDDINAQDARVAAQIDADISVEHIANVYAKALLGAADTAGVMVTVLEELDALIRQVLDRYPKFEAVLASGLVSAEEKAQLIDRVFKTKFSTTMVHFLKVAASRGRLDCLRAIQRQTQEQYDRQRGRVRVDLTTAAPVDSAVTRRLADSLQPLVGGEPIVSHRVDPELIGGMVVRVGDTVYDGSVANQLKNIRQQMIDRSVHEIQSRRDRFRDPAGD